MKSRTLLLLMFLIISFQYYWIVTCHSPKPTQQVTFTYRNTEYNLSHIATYTVESFDHLIISKRVSLFYCHLSAPTISITFDHSDYSKKKFDSLIQELDTILSL